MTTIQILASIALAVLVLILAGCLSRRHARGPRREYPGDPGTWVPSMSVDSGHAACDSGSSGGDCGAH